MKGEEYPSELGSLLPLPSACSGKPKNAFFLGIESMLPEQIQQPFSGTLEDDISKCKDCFQYLKK